MASLSKQQAEVVSAYLRSQTRPALPNTVLSETDDFRVVMSRMHYERHELEDCELHTFIVVRPRPVMESAIRDRCGFRFGYTMEVGFVRKLESWVEGGQPANEVDMDACMQYVEWVQDTLGNKIQQGERALGTIEILAMPDEDRLQTGMWIGELGLIYA